MNTTDPDMAPVWSALRSLLIAVGMLMAYAGVSTNSRIYQAVEFASSAVLVICPAIWGVWAAIARVRAQSRVVAGAVQAGINLAASGKALAEDGSYMVLSHASGDTVPPKPVTVESAAQIVKDFAPEVTPK